MAQEWAKTFYNSAKWQLCRKAFIDSRILADGGMCQECGVQPGYIVHHKVILTAENICDPDITLNHDQLLYVCKKCHDKFEGHGLQKNAGVKPLCTFDEDGQPISLREIDNPPIKTDKTK